MKLRKTVITGVTAVAATLTVAAAPASAADTAYNTRTSYLTAAPTAAMDTSCTTRSIGLASGTYNWHLNIGGNVSSPRSTYLAAGTYTWTTCLDPQNGYYDMYSTLDKAGSGPAAIASSFRLSPSGTYTWGSAVDPKF
ncbi:hypothetical protein ACIQVC_17320 [Streptomyces sp. NPDC101112]|uniref:hypothetical protein n=1 Tax=Streptomyces sp. NPDC101112 TaxID=3366105 RepID=UPI003829E72C